MVELENIVVELGNKRGIGKRLILLQLCMLSEFKKFDLRFDFKFLGPSWPFFNGDRVGGTELAGPSWLGTELAGTELAGLRWQDRGGRTEVTPTGVKGGWHQ